MTKKRKVLMLVENTPVPQDHRVWPEAIVLRDNGYQVSIISPKGVKDQRESSICIDGIHIYRYHLPVIEQKFIGHIVEYSIALMMTFLLSVKVLFKQGFDVIHTANPPDIFFLIGMFYHMLGKKFIFDQHDLSPELFQVIFKKRAQLIYKVMRFFELCSCTMADVVIVTNESQKRFAIQRSHCQPEKVFVVRNGPVMKYWYELLSNPTLKTGQPFLLGYIGIMGVQDGVDNAIYALEELVHRRGRNDISLILLGDGPYLPVLRTLAHDLRLENHINFMGLIPHEDVASILSRIDIGLIPDPLNGLNEYSTMMKTMDYMAASKPIVAFDLEETRCSAGESALYARPNLVQDFADKVEELLADAELRCKMGRLGRQRIEEELRWEITSKNLVFAYEVLFPDRRSISVSRELQQIS